MNDIHILLSMIDHVKVQLNQVRASKQKQAELQVFKHLVSLYEQLNAKLAEQAELAKKSTFTA